MDQTIPPNKSEIFATKNDHYDGGGDDDPSKMVTKWVKTISIAAIVFCKDLKCWLTVSLLFVAHSICVVSFKKTNRFFLMNVLWSAIDWCLSIELF